MDYAKMPKMMIAGFKGIPMDEPMLTNAENKKNYVIAVQDWNYGPEVPTNESGANKEFYAGLAEAMQCDEKEARHKHCSNCGYYDNSLMAQVRIERIPMAAYDKGAGFRGHCEKLNFICNDMRVCQAWEDREEDED
jgi:hypothetical protein